LAPTTKERAVSKHQEQIVAAAKGKVDEEILGAAWAKPRGATTAAAGGGLIASEIGARWAGKHNSAGGSTFKLEGKAGDMKALAEVFERAKASA
jgi:hypothetical protein